jgi:hypothetical protein
MRTIGDIFRDLRRRKVRKHRYDNLHKCKYCGSYRYAIEKVDCLRAVAFTSI